MKMFGVSKSILLLIIVVTPFSGRVQDSLIGHVEMYAFFYPKQDSVEEASFRADIASGVLEKGKIEDAFQRHGSGPMGSHWNPFNDLLICFYVPKKNDSLIQVEVGDSLIDSLKAVDDFIWLKIPQENWEGLLKPVGQDNYELVYGKDYQDRYPNPIAPFDTGYYLEIELLCGDAKITQIIHVEYGE